MNIDGLYQVAVLALATTSIALTVAQAQIFAPARGWIAKRNHWLGELVSCSYCTSHWVALALVAIYRPTLVECWRVADLVVSVFVVVTISTVVSTLITLLQRLRDSARDADNPAHSIRTNSGNDREWNSNGKEV